MLDPYEVALPERVVRRHGHAHHLDRAIQKTKRLLSSPAAQDPHLKQLWETRLERQHQNLMGVCK